MKLPSILHTQIPVHWNMNKASGLPTNTVYKIIQDNNKIIWIGTSAGLIKYNSVEMFRFTSNTLLNNEFITLNLDSTNRVWVSNFSSQIAYVYNDKLNVVALKNTPAPIKKIKLFFTKQFLFIAANFSNNPQKYNFRSALYKIPIAEISHKLDLEKYLLDYYESQISKLLKNNHGGLTILFAEVGSYTIKKITAYKEIAKQVPKDVENRLNSWGVKSQQIEFLSIETGGHVIFGDGRFLFWNEQGKIIYKKTGKTINTVAKVGDIFWLLTTEGIYFINYENGKLSPTPIFPDYPFSTFFKDSEGNIWLGTLDRGILIIPSVDFQHPSYNQSPFFSLYSLTNSAFLCGSRNQLTLFKKNNKPVNLLVSPKAGRILSIYEKNSMIVLASDNGVYWTEELTKAHFSLIDYSKASKAVFLDDDEKLWQGRYNSFSYYGTKKNWQELPQALIKEKTFAIEEDQYKNIWAGTTSGLYKINPSKHTLRVGTDSISYFVKAIKASSGAILFVATCNKGILKVNTLNNSVNTIILPYEDCFTSLLYEENGLWIGGNKGIIYYNLIDHTTHQISRYDGLPSNEVNDLISSGEFIWAATAKGLVRFPKAVVNKKRTPATITIKKISVNGDEVANNHLSLDLKYIQNNIKIEFETINFYLRGTTEFKYRLLPSKKWFTTYQPYAQFTNLKSGNYEFEVSLVNNVPIAKFPKLSFNIDSPWWQKIWLQSLILVTIIGLTAWWGYSRQQKAMAKEKEKRANQNLITELKMTALQAQMNPHFIFNCLNTIQSFIFKNDTLRATESLGMFSKLIRNVFEYSEEKTLSLEKEIDFLHLYINLEQLRFDEDLEVKIALSDFVNENLFALQVPPLLIQPIIENAFAHGLMHLSGQKKLSICFEMKGSYLKCTVTDNGVGRAYTEASNNWEIKNKKSSGLILTKQRLKTFNNQTKDNNKLENCFVITDLKDKTNETAIGTQIEMYIKND